MRLQPTRLGINFSANSRSSWNFTNTDEFFKSLIYQKNEHNQQQVCGTTQTGHERKHNSMEKT